MNQASRLNFKQEETRNMITDKTVGHDPFLYVNRIIRDRIKQQRISHLAPPLGLHIILVAALQPLNVVGTLLQLSVKEHKNIHDSPPANKLSDINNQPRSSKAKIQSTAISRINKDITMAEKRKIELQILSGVKHKPFTAPVYDSYKSVIRDLYNQGFQSFFKGLFSTTLIQCQRSCLRYGILGPYIYRQKGNAPPMTTKLISYGILTFMDCMLNYLHVAEARFILQSRAPQFSTYRDLRQFLRNNLVGGRSLYAGYKTHFLRNLFIIGSGFNCTIPIFIANYLLMYPIDTAYKRIICQSQDAGMIPQRYGSVWHAFKLILQQQGFRGLYRGFIANAVKQLSLFFIFTRVYAAIVLEQNSYWLSGIYSLKGRNAH